MDLLTRAQAKRINDQRCDPDMLADLTNRTNGSVRQSDSLMCTGGIRFFWSAFICFFFFF